MLRRTDAQPSRQELAALAKFLEGALLHIEASEKQTVRHCAELERRLLDIEWAFYASTSWLGRNDRPQGISDLGDFISPQPALRAYLEKHVLGEGRLPPGAIEVDSHALARDLMLSGFGVALLPQGLGQDAVTSGQAQTLLPQTALCPTRLNLTFPNRGDMVPRVRAFADHICAHYR